MASYPTITNTSGLDAAVVDEFETHNAQLEGYLSVEHHGDGTHKKVTADTLSGTVQALVTAVLQPPQITRDQSDYNPAGLATASVLWFDTSAAWAITGIVAAAENGTRLVLYNSGQFPLTLRHNSIGSLETNRFYFDTVADVVLNTATLVEVIYLNGRWRRVN